MRFSGRKLALLMALLLALTGCGGEEVTEKEAPNGDVYNTADVAFAQDMIQHHAQALVMVDLLQGRQVSAGLTTLSEGILSSQTAEIETMTTWLIEWDEQVPATLRDHVNAGHGEDDHTQHDEEGDTGQGMPGMLDSEELAELEATQGGAFERAWAAAMIEHHEGAIEMAEEQQQDGLFEPAVALAREIEKAQAAEIEALEGLS